MHGTALRAELGQMNALIRLIRVELRAPHPGLGMVRPFGAVKFDSNRRQVIPPVLVVLWDRLLSMGGRLLNSSLFFGEGEQRLDVSCQLI